MLSNLTELGIVYVVEIEYACSRVAVPMVAVRSRAELIRTTSLTRLREWTSLINTQQSGYAVDEYLLMATCKEGLCDSVQHPIIYVSCYCESRVLP
jgi:hypothetical protein